MEIKNRTEYLDGTISHREYYAQFVTEGTKKIVDTHIGKYALQKSTDEHLNDISLGSWDTLPKEYNREALKEAGESMTMATWVCIAKEAAYQLIESYV